MKDLIDREAALNCFHSWVDKYGDVYTPDDIPEYRAIEALPSAQPDEEKISDLLYDVYRLTCPQLGTGGVAVLKSYISMVYREIFGEEGPEWMR